MEILIKVLQFILSFSLLVIIHELGHFFFARLFGTRVEKFYLFFNPWFSIFKIKRGETTYGMGWIPFGGYVKIAGMIDESMDTEQLKQPIQPYEFRAKPAWQRLLIMVGGVLMNIVLAVCIYIGIAAAWGETYIATEDATYGYVFSDLAHEIGFEDGDRVVDVAGEPVEDAAKVFVTMVIDQAPYVTVERAGAQVRVDIPQARLPELLHSKDFMSLRVPFVVGAVSPDGGAERAGIEAGDRLVALGGELMEGIDQYLAAFAQHKSQTVELVVERDSAGVKRAVTLPVEVSEQGMIGVQLQSFDKLLTISTREFTLLQAIPQGFKLAGEQIANVGKQIKMLFTPKTEAYKSLGGLLSIGNIFPTSWDWEAFWQLTAFFSVMLALMNILPIPALDGGHVLFLLVEVVSGRKPGDKFIEWTQTIGIFLLMGLMLYANANDIYRLFIQ